MNKQVKIPITASCGVLDPFSLNQKIQTTSPINSQKRNAEKTANFRGKATKNFLFLRKYCIEHSESIT